MQLKNVIINIFLQVPVLERFPHIKAERVQGQLMVMEVFNRRNIIAGLAVEQQEEILSLDNYSSRGRNFIVISYV